MFPRMMRKRKPGHPDWAGSSRTAFGASLDSLDVMEKTEGEPRKHHIIPAFYLAGFTNTGSPSGLLQVFDYRSGKRYKSTPRRACRQTDYFRVEEPGLDSNYIEKVLAWHEGVVAPFVQGIARTGKVESKRQIGEALALAASIAVRDQRSRQQLEVGLAAGLATRLRRGEVTREQWEQLRDAELRNGACASEVPEYEEAKARLRNGDWFPRAPVVLKVGLIPELQGAFLKILQRRHWELHVTDSSANGGFICSNSPLVWGDLERAVRGHQDNLEDPYVEVTFPVGKDAALISYPNGREATCSTTDEIVAHVNMRTLQMSNGLVFHCDDDFLLRRRSGEISHGSDYFAYVADARRRGIIQP